MEYEVLDKEQVKEIYTKIFQNYRTNANKLIIQSGVSFSDNEKHKLENILFSLQNVYGIFNVDFSKEKDELIKNLREKDLKQFKKFVSKRKREAQSYKYFIDKVVIDGEKIRKEENTPYPEIFKKNKTIFIKIKDAKSAKVKQDELLEELKNSGAEISLINRESSTYIENEKNTEKLQTFFSRRSKILDKVISKYSKLDFSDKELFMMIENGDYETAKALMISRGKSKEKKNTDLREIIMDKVLFLHISKELNKKKITAKNFMPYLKDLSFKYADLADSLHYSASRNAINEKQEINLLQISIDPKQIATMATYTDWKSCMTANDIYWEKIEGDIGRGTIVVYAINDKNPQKKISRSLLKPYISDKNNQEIVYLQNKQYGAQIEEFKQVVDRINEDIITKKDPIGSYQIRKDIYLDDMPSKALLGNNLDIEEMFKIKGTNYKKENNTFIINDNVEFSGAFGLKEIKEDLIIDGSLDLQYCTKLNKLPQNIKTEYSIYLKSCKNLRKVTSNIKTNKNVYFTRSSNLNELTGKFVVMGDMDFSECTGLQNLPNNMYVKERLVITHCPSIEKLPDNLNVGSLKLEYCNNIKELPDNLNIIGDVEVTSATLLAKIPRNMNVGGNINLSRCSEIKELPNDLKVGKDINLSLCKSLVKISDNYEVSGSFNLSGCSKLSALPKGLKVERNLDISGTAITKLPDDIVVNGQLKFSNKDQITALPPGVKKASINGIILSKEKMAVLKENWVKEKSVIKDTIHAQPSM